MNAKKVWGHIRDILYWLWVCIAVWIVLLLLVFIAFAVGVVKRVEEKNLSALPSNRPALLAKAAAFRAERAFKELI